MKKSIKFLAGAVALAGLVACDKTEFKSYPFILLETSSVEASEDAGSISIPVYAYAEHDGVAFPRSETANTTVTFEVVPGVDGVGYSVEPANGMLTFSNTSEAAITVNITNDPGVYTGNASFTIRLTGASDGYTLVSGSKEVQVSLSDNDHPLSALFGTYTANNITDAFGDTYNISTTISAVAGTTDQVTLTNLCPYLVSLGYTHSVVGSVSEDMTTITVEGGQIIANVAYFYAVSYFDGESVNLGDELVFTIDTESGELVLPSGGYGAYNSGFYDLIYTDGPLVFTRQ